MNCATETTPTLRKSKRHGGDHRGNAASRRARKLWMLAQARWNGNGAECDCVHCGGRLTFATVEADRIVPGGPYARHNIQPSCRACNLARSDNAAWVGSLAHAAA